MVIILRMKISWGENSIAYRQVGREHRQSISQSVTKSFRNP